MASNDGDNDNESTVSSSQSSQSVDETIVDLSSALPEAIKNGSMENVRKLMKHHGAVRTLFFHHFEEINENGDNNTTPLMLAAGLGHIDIVKLLLEHGASVDDVTSSDGSAPIQLAALYGQCEALNLLLDAGASINDRNADGFTALDWACKWGHLEAVKLLVSRGADPNLADTDGWCPLAYAARYGYPEITRYLLSLEGNVEERGIIVHRKLVDRNIRANSNYTPLIGAIYYSDIECVKVLLSDRDVDVSAQDSDGETALCMAARRGYISIMLQILGTQVYFPDDPVGEVSCIATSSEHYFIERTLLRRFEQAMRTAEEQARTMYWVVANGSLQLIQKCLQLQPDLARWSRMGATWLHVAAKYGRHQLIEELVTSGLEICTTAIRGMTPLHLAAQGGHRIAVRCILEILRRRDSKTTVSAARAPLFPGLELIQFILKPNDDGESPLTLSGKASTQGGSDILWGEIEKFATANPDFVETIPVGLENLLELAAQFERPGEERILKLLLKQISGKGLNWKSQNWTALHWAVVRSRPVLVWWLLSNGAHLRSEEIQIALEIVKQKTNRGHAISEMDLVITDLLRNPPTISARAVNEDDYHLPELPELSEDFREVLDHDSLVVDFFCHDKTADFKIKRRNLREIIYEQGPSGIMTSAGTYDYRNIEGLKEQLNNIQQTPHIARRATSEVEPLTYSTVAQDSFKGKESGLQDSIGNNKPTLTFTTAEKQRDFRWIHIPARDLKLAEDLITRIIIDSGKKKRQHASIVNLLKQSLVEVAAGGGKRYIKPQCVRIHVDEDEDEQDSNSSDDEDDDDNNDDGDADNENDGDTDSDTSSDTSSDLSNWNTSGKESVALYMPFLTVAEIPASTASHDEAESRRQIVSSYIASSHDDDKDPSKILYGRMTLDQFYYTTIPDSTDRDHDQVLSRYLAWQEFKYFDDNEMVTTELLEQAGKSIKIFAVDQLWLWIVDESTIVTATTSDFEDFVDMAFDTLVSEETKGGIPRPQSVQSMIECILRIVTGPQMQNVPVMGKKKPKQPMEVFRESIRHVADIETEMSRSFVDSVVRGHFNILPKRDMGREFRLLYEIKDIREELNMLKSLTETQKRVWRQALRTSLSKYPHLQTPRQVALEIKEVAREAESTQDAINTLLELRQKHAGNQDAEFGRQQANTTLVFTIVTIIFLPLSFLSSLFALNVSEFPHESDGVKYRASWIFPIIFGCTAAFSIPSIVIAFNINDLILKPYYRWRSSSQPDLNRHLGAYTVRRLTEEAGRYVADSDSASMDALFRGGRTTVQGGSRQLAPRSVSSFYDRLIGKPPQYTYRRAYDCESGRE